MGNASSCALTLIIEVSLRDIRHLKRKRHHTDGAGPCQLGRQSAIDLARRHGETDIDKEEQGGGEFGHRIDLVAATDSQSGSTKQEEWDIGTEAAGQAKEIAGRKRDPPEGLERQEGDRRVAASAAEPTGHRNPLLDLDLDALLNASHLPEEGDCPGDKILLPEGNSRMVTGEDGPGLTSAKVERIGEVDCLEESPQLVIAIRTLSEDFERPVDLGEGG